MVETISRKELQEKISSEEDYFLVEVLPRPTYEHAHLPGAINIPPDQVSELAPQLLPDKGAEIVVYCSNFN